eukprot:6612660-Prymnesium_polylepis.1
MAPKRKSGGSGKGSQSSLLGGGFDFESYPQLKKPMEVIGKTIRVKGTYWKNCPEVQRDIEFQCT